MSLFFPLKTTQVWQTNQGFFCKAQLFWSVLAPPPASQPLLPLPPWKLTANPTAIRCWHDMTGFPTKIPHLLITSSLDHGQLITGLMSTWANQELLSRGMRDSCSLGFECSRLQHHKFGPMVELEHKPRVDWRLLPHAGHIPNTRESSKVHFFLNHVTLRPSDDTNYLVPICNLPDPIWEHHGHHCIETPLHCHVGIYHLNVKDSCKTHCWTTWLFLFDKKDKNSQFLAISA